MDCEQKTQLLAADDEECHSPKAAAVRRSRGRLGNKNAAPKLFLALSLALILSLLCNIIFFITSLRSSKHSSPISCTENQPSVYGTSASVLGNFHAKKRDHRKAGLRKTQELPQHHNTDWWGLNETLSEQLWATIKTEQGMVALPNDFTDAKGLPRGVAFPWDTSKSVYFVQAYHTLHCLVSSALFPKIKKNTCKYR